MGQFDAWENEIQKPKKVTNQFDVWESELQTQPAKPTSQFDIWENEIKSNVEPLPPSVLDMPPVQEQQPLLNASDYAKSAASDLPVAASSMLSGIAGFGTDALKGAAKAVEAVPQTILQNINPAFNNPSLAGIQEARRQNIDIAADTLKGMYENAAANTQQYYTGTRPEENYNSVSPKTELLPDDYAARMAKLSGKQNPQPIFSNIPGGREVIQTAKAIPEFAVMSAEELGRIAGALSAGDIDTANQVLSKPFSTVGIPAVGVVTGPTVALSLKRGFEKAPEAKIKEEVLSPEDVKYLEEYNKELEAAKQNKPQPEIPVEDMSAGGMSADDLASTVLPIPKNQKVTTDYLTSKSDVQPEIINNAPEPQQQAFEAGESKRKHYYIRTSHDIEGDMQRGWSGLIGGRGNNLADLLNKNKWIENEIKSEYEKTDKNESYEEFAERQLNEKWDIRTDPKTGQKVVVHHGGLSSQYVPTDRIADMAEIERIANNQNINYGEGGHILPKDAKLIKELTERDATKNSFDYNPDGTPRGRSKAYLFESYEKPVAETYENAGKKTLPEESTAINEPVVKKVSEIVAEKKAEGLTGKSLAQAVREEVAAQKETETVKYNNSIDLNNQKKYNTTQPKRGLSSNFGIEAQNAYEKAVEFVKRKLTEKDIAEEVIQKEAESWYDPSQRNPIEKVVGFRYGKAPENGASWNYAENKPEIGVSMASAMGLPESEGFATLEAKKSRKPFYYEGDAVGFGGDGEIIMKNIKEITPTEYQQKVKSPENLRAKLIDLKSKLIFWEKRLKNDIEEARIRFAFSKDDPLTANDVILSQKKVNALQEEYNKTYSDLSNILKTPDKPDSGSGAPPASLFKDNNKKKGAVSIGPIIDNIAQGYKVLRDKLMTKREQSNEFMSGPMDNITTLLWEKYWPALKEIENKLGKNEAGKVFEDIERQRYSDNVMKAYLKDSGLMDDVLKTLKENDIDPDQYGAYNEARRVLFEPNPHGKDFRLTHDEAYLALQEFTPKQRIALKKVHAQENAIRQSTVIPEWKNSEVFSDDIIKFMEANDNYSRNVVAEYALKNVPKSDKASGELLKRIGSTKDIFNPWEQKIIGDRATTQFASRQAARRSVVEALEKSGAAQTKPFDNSEAVEYMHKGNWITKYVPKDMATAFNYFPEELSKAEKFADWLTVDNAFSRLMEKQLIHNPGFVLGNSLLLDPITTWWQISDLKSSVLYPMVHMLTLAEKMGSSKAGFIAQKLGLKDAVTLNKEMTQNRIYNVGSLADRASGANETQLAAMLENLGMTKDMIEFFGAPKGLRGKIADKTGLSKVWQGFEQLAQAADNSSKESLYNYLTRFRKDLPQEKINQMVREMGTPATKRQGSAEGIIRRTTLFGNAALQGARASFKNMKDAPAVFAIKNIGVPAALAYGFYQWATHDKTYKSLFDKLSDYQKKNFLNFYIGEKEGKPLVVSLPLPRFARNIYALTLDLLEGDKSFGENMQTFIEGLTTTGFSEIPTSAKQYINLAIDVKKYMSGEPIYDSYRKQPVIPSRVLDADATAYNRIFGDSNLNNMDTSKAFGKYLLNNYIMGGWFKYDVGKEIPKGYGFTQWPAVSRVVKIASGGVEKKLGDVINDQKKMKARAGLQLQKTAENTIREGKPLELSKEDIEALQISPGSLQFSLLKEVLRKAKKEDTSNLMKLINALNGQDTKTQLKLLLEYKKRGF